MKFLFSVYRMLYPHCKYSYEMSGNLKATIWQANHSTITILVLLCAVCTFALTRTRFYWLMFCFVHSFYLHSVFFSACLFFHSVSSSAGFVVSFNGKIDAIYVQYLSSINMLFIWHIHNFSIEILIRINNFITVWRVSAFGSFCFQFHPIWNC